MSPTTPRDVTQMLCRMAGGDSQALQELMPLVYDELRAQAERYLRHERPGPTLQATALVHDAYLRLVASTEQNWRNRTHFFAAAASAIRRILIEHARSRSRLKRGGDMQRVSLEQAEHAAAAHDQQLLMVDQALKELAETDPFAAKVVELRFFAGLTVDEVATVLGSSSSTVARAWRMARAWLELQLETTGRES